MTCGVVIAVMCPACLMVAGGAWAERWKLSHSPSSATRDARPLMPSSSLTAASRSQYHVDLLAQLPDPRKRRGRRHSLAGLLAVGIAAVTADSRSFAATGQWAADAGADVLAGLGAVRGPAEESTFRRAFALISVDVLHQVIDAWFHTRATQAGGRRVIAVDGKPVCGARNDYVMTVKANMPTLYKQPKKLPCTIPATSAVSTGHGRRACRTIRAVLVPAWIEFEGAAQVAQVRRTVTKKGRKTVEVVYLITSDRDADPATLAAWVRGHWEIENRLHRASETLRRSRTSRPRCGYGPRAC